MQDFKQKLSAHDFTIFDKQQFTEAMKTKETFTVYEAKTVIFSRLLGSVEQTYKVFCTVIRADLIPRLCTNFQTLGWPTKQLICVNSFLTECIIRCYYEVLKNCSRWLKQFKKIIKSFTGPILNAAYALTSNVPRFASNFFVSDAFQKPDFAEMKNESIEDCFAIKIVEFKDSVIWPYKSTYILIIIYLFTCGVFAVCLAN